MSVTADLCRLPLPSGQYCRQIALKGEYLCRHHRRLLDKTEAEALHEEAMERLALKLAALSIPDLLDALYGKLSRVRSAVRAYPEAQLALGITLERLRTMRQDSIEAPIPPRSTPINFSENPIESMNYDAPDFQRTL
jgi:hypothetical protein